LADACGAEAKFAIIVLQERKEEKRIVKSAQQT
jgi:hypothetical protein